MSSLPPVPPSEDASALPVVEAGVPASAAAASPPATTATTLQRGVLFVLVLLAGSALVLALLLWQRLGNIQEQLARQSADSAANAVEARTLARQAQEIARDAAARQAVLETRLSEVALQRAQLEDLMQSLSRSRDENLVVDIESALRLAQQQTQLTGSPEPLLAALRTADQRLARAAQPRLNRLRGAVGRDIERIRAAAVTDVPGLMVRIDEIVRQIDDLPLANAVPVRSATQAASATRAGTTVAVPWWDRWTQAVLEDVRSLLRVSRIEHPDAVLVAPDQGFFLRENLKLKLLNARLSLLARQTEAARADIATASTALSRYFDPSARRTQLAMGQLAQLQAQTRLVEVPRIDETLAAIATAAAGR